jgi:hypothetical protein
VSQVIEFKPFKSDMQWSNVLGGDLNPISGFCFPLFSMVFPWGISIRVETRKAERVSQQFLTDLELGPLGWRGLWAGNR